MLSHDLRRKSLRPSLTVQSRRWAVYPAVLQLHQALQVFDVPDGCSQRFHLTKPLVGALTRKVVPQFGITLIHTSHPLTLSLIPFLDECWLKGTLIHTKVSMVLERGQVRQEPRASQRTLVGVQAGAIEKEGDRAGQRVITVSSRGRQTKTQVRWRRNSRTHHVTCVHACWRGTHLPGRNTPMRSAELEECSSSPAGEQLKSWSQYGNYWMTVMIPTSFLWHAKDRNVREVVKVTWLVTWCHEIEEFVWTQTVNVWNNTLYVLGCLVSPHYLLWVLLLLWLLSLLLIIVSNCCYYWWDSTLTLWTQSWCRPHSDIISYWLLVYRDPTFIDS